MDMRFDTVGKPEGKRPLERPRRRWEDVLKMDLRETVRGDVEWIHLAQNRDRWQAVVNAVLNLLVLAPWCYFFNTWWKWLNLSLNII
jgi:hypothetical protein